MFQRRCDFFPFDRAQKNGIDSLLYHLIDLLNLRIHIQLRIHRNHRAPFILHILTKRLLQCNKIRILHCDTTEPKGIRHRFLLIFFRLYCIILTGPHIFLTTCNHHTTHKKCKKQCYFSLIHTKPP